MSLKEAIQKLEEFPETRVKYDRSLSENMATGSFLDRDRELGCYTAGKVQDGLIELYIIVEAHLRAPEHRFGKLWVSFWIPVDDFIVDSTN